VARLLVCLVQDDAQVHAVMRAADARGELAGTLRHARAAAVGVRD
jgi:hypothetical protein